MTLDHAAGQTPSPTPPSPLRQFIEQQPRAATIVGVGIIIFATLLAYTHAMRAGFIWDDDYYVENNPLLRSFDGLERIWFGVMPDPAAYPLPQYYPMTHTSFWLEYRLWGLNPAGFHVVNVVLHIGNALLLWLLLRKLDVPGAWLAAAIFALHPINVESVAWIAERKNVLSLLFYLASLYVLLRFAGVIPGKIQALKAELAPSERPQTTIEWFTLPNDPQRLYALAAVLFLCALFSKTVASSMPVVALLIIWWKRGRLTVKDLAPLVPLIVVGAAMGMLTAYMERVRVGVGARPEEWDYAASALGEFGARCIIAGKVFWFYLQKIFFPHPLIFNYPRWSIDAGSFLQYLPFAAAVILGVAVLALRKVVGGGVVLAALVYGITLFPAMGFIDVWPMQYSFVADHFVYIPAIAVIALVAALIARYLPIELVAGVVGVVLFLFLGLTFNQAQMYLDRETLWTQTLKRTDQQSWMAANNYAVLLLDRDRRGDVVAAEQWLHSVLRKKPDHPEARLNLARIELKRAEFAQAIRARAASTQPTPELNELLATTQEPKLLYDKAMQWLREAIRVQPNYVDAHYLLAQILLKLGRTDEASAELHTVLELYPRHELASLALGSLLLDKGDLEGAGRQFLNAIDANPDSIPGHERLGFVLLQQGQIGLGLAEWEQVLRLDPTNPDWPNRFGAMLADAGEYRQAADFFKIARQMQPGNVEAMNNIGITAARAGFAAEAEQWFDRAIETDPTFTKARENLAALKAGRLRPTTTRAVTQPASFPGR